VEEKSFQTTYELFREADVQTLVQENCAAIARPATFTELRCSEMWRIALSHVGSATFVLFWVHFTWDYLPPESDYSAEESCSRFKEQFDSQSMSGAIEHFFGMIGGFTMIEKIVGKIGCHNWFRTDSLVQDVAVLAAVKMFTSWISGLDPLHLVKKSLEQLWVRYQLRKGKGSTMTQSEVNSVFEGPEAKLPQRYAHMINMLAFTLSFLPLMPILSFLGFLGLCLKYWADKYFVLRLANHPSFYEHDIAVAAVRIVCMLCWPQAALSVILLAPSISKDNSLSRMMVVSFAFSVVTFTCTLWIWFHQNVGRKLHLFDRLDLNLLEKFAVYADDAAGKEGIYAKEGTYNKSWKEISLLSTGQSYFEAKPSFLFKYTKLDPVWSYMPHEVEHHGVDPAASEGKKLGETVTMVKRLTRTKKVSAFRKRG